jgi:hypothetical protein
MSEPSFSPEAARLLGDFLASRGLAADSLAEGDTLQFTAGAYVVGVSPLPGAAGLMTLEIQVRVLDLTDSPFQTRRLLFLHRLNESLRQLTGWMATINPDDVLCLSQKWRVHEHSVARLDALVREGLARADALAEVWDAWTDDSGEAEPDPDATPGGLLRV